MLFIEAQISERRCHRLNAEDTGERSRTPVALNAPLAPNC